MTEAARTKVRIRCRICLSSLDLFCFPFPDASSGRRRARCFLCFYTDNRLKKKRRHNLQMRIYANAQCEDLSDQYVRRVVTASTGILYSEIPQELIEVKRKHLQLLRKIKELTDER